MIRDIWTPHPDLQFWIWIETSFSSFLEFVHSTIFEIFSALAMHVIDNRYSYHWKKPDRKNNRKTLFADLHCSVRISIGSHLDLNCFLRLCLAISNWKNCFLVILFCRDGVKTHNVSMSAGKNQVESALIEYHTNCLSWNLHQS